MLSSIDREMRRCGRVRSAWLLLFSQRRAPARRHKALAQIYGVRASLLAAASPDEDFVESYRLDVLSRAGLGSLVFEIPRINTSFNVLSRSGRGRDGAKCVAAFAARQRLQPRR
jgi:hypothetical protein